jgi:hypothetical protein
MKPQTDFIFGQLADEGLRVVLKGAFTHGQLAACALNGCEWRRRPGETAEGFERRVIDDIRQLLQPVQSSAFFESPAAIESLAK